MSASQPDHRGQLDVNDHYQTARAAHLRRGRRGRLSLAGQRRRTSKGASRPRTYCGEPSHHLVQRHSDRHLHEPRDLFDRQTERQLTDEQRAVRDRQRALQASGPGPDHRPDGGHAQDAVSSRNTGRCWASTASARTPSEIIHIGQAIMSQPGAATRCCISSTRRSTIRRWPKPIAWRR